MSGHEFVPLGGLKFVRFPSLVLVQTEGEKDEFQPGSKFVWYRVNGVFYY